MGDEFGRYRSYSVDIYAPQERVKVPVLTGDQIKDLSPAEHNARAMVLNMFFDRHTNSYRFRSPEGSNYTYSGSLDANTLAELPRGEVRQREKDYFNHAGKGNTVSNIRLGI